MPRYSFCVRNGTVLYPRFDDVDLPNVDAAREEALRRVRALIAQRLAVGESIGSTQIEAFDERGALALVLPLDSVHDEQS